MLTQDEFKLFTTLIYERGGIRLKEAQRTYLENKLRRRMAETGASTPYQYYRFVVKEEEGEMLRLLDELTINETSFFRNRPQMDLFRTVALPELVNTKRQHGVRELRIWSAGCSTGEEPYSLAMILLDLFQFMPDRDEWKLKVFASDVSLTALEKASRGEYDRDRVLGSVDEHYLDRYFERDGDVYRVRDIVKRLVVFDFHNLKHDNGLSGLDAIFCRNVMIYFDANEQERLVKKFIKSLAPGGYLFLGHAETLHGMNTGLKFIYKDKGTAYRKPGEVWNVKSASCRG